jgi:hypothetical protein
LVSRNFRGSGGCTHSRWCTPNQSLKYVDIGTPKCTTTIHEWKNGLVYTTYFELQKFIAYSYRFRICQFFFENSWFSIANALKIVSCIASTWKHAELLKPSGMGAVTLSKIGCSPFSTTIPIYMVQQ